MHVLILGATGITGQLLVEAALKSEHQITVLVRDAAKFGIVHQNLTILTGDVLDETALLNSLKGKDAVLSTLGRGKTLKSANLMTKAVTNLISCMNATKVNRVIMLSAFGVGDTILQANFIQRLIFRTFLKNIFNDKSEADALLRRSGYDWTLVYPVVLTNGPGTGNYKVGETLPMKGVPKISRADVAHFMLQQLNNNSYVKKTAVLMS